MFRISIIELAFVCLVSVLLIVLPVVFARYMRRTQQRLDELEKRNHKRNE